LKNVTNDRREFYIDIANKSWLIFH
jgi:hypothetical protein